MPVSTNVLETHVEYFVCHNYIFTGFINAKRNIFFNAGEKRSDKTITVFHTSIKDDVELYGDWFTESHNLFPRLALRKRHYVP